MNNDLDLICVCIQYKYIVHLGEDSCGATAGQPQHTFTTSTHVMHIVSLSPLMLVFIRYSSPLPVA